MMNVMRLRVTIPLLLYHVALARQMRCRSRRDVLSHLEALLDLCNWHLTGRCTSITLVLRDEILENANIISSVVIRGVCCLGAQDRMNHKLVTMKLSVLLSCRV